LIFVKLASGYNRMIAIIGMGCRFPGGSNTVESYWGRLRQGQDIIAPFPTSRRAGWGGVEHVVDGLPSIWGGFIEGIDYRSFDRSFFQMSYKEASCLDPQHRMLLEVSWEALESAYVVPSRLHEKAVGVFTGISTTDYQAEQIWNGNWVDAEIYCGLGSLPSTASGRLSHFLGLNGPNLSIDTACSSSLVAFHYACQSLLQGECEMALAGGVNFLLSPQPYLLLSRMGVLSPDGRCKTFDALANGYVRSEGCGMVVLKRLENALADGDSIQAVCLGSAVNHDGRSESLTAPNPLSQKKLLESVLNKASVSPDDVDYIEAHGTGNPLGDKTELTVFTDIFGGGHRTHPLYIGSVKSNIGHLEAAAGIAGLIKVVCGLRDSVLTGNCHFSNPAPVIDWDVVPLRVPTQLQVWPEKTGRNIAGISSFGISGTNAHVLLTDGRSFRGSDTSTPGQAGFRRSVVKKKRDFILPLSAVSEKSLAAVVRLYSVWLNQGEPSLRDVCCTAALHREHFKTRAAFCGKQKGEILAAMDAWLRGEEVFSQHRTEEESDWMAELRTFMDECGIQQEPLDKDESSRVSFYMEEEPEGIGIQYGTSTWLFQRPFLGEGNRVRFLALLYSRGFSVNWEYLYDGFAYEKISLPTYPFQREKVYREKMPQHSPSQKDHSAMAQAWKSKDMPETDWIDHLRAISPIQREKLIREKIVSLVDSIAGSGNPEPIHEDRPLLEQGLHSLLAVEFCQRIRMTFGVPISTTFLFNYPTITDITHTLSEQLKPGVDRPQDKATPTGESVDSPVQSSSKDGDFDFMDGLDAESLEKFIKENLDSI
jgi:acyl transferase domain-containing protein